MRPVAWINMLLPSQWQFRKFDRSDVIGLKRNIYKTETLYRFDGDIRFQIAKHKTLKVDRIGIGYYPSNGRDASFVLSEFAGTPHYALKTLDDRTLIDKENDDKYLPINTEIILPAEMVDSNFKKKPKHM